MNVEAAVLAFLARTEYAPMRLEEIIQHIGGDKSDLRQMRKIVPALIKSGAIIVKSRDLLALPEGDALPEGIILFRASGSARVVFTAVPGEKPREPIHIDAKDTGVALHGDRVVIKLNRTRRERGQEDWGTGTVVRVTQRALTSLTGTLRQTRLVWFVVPDDPRISRDIVVRDPSRSGLKSIPKEEDKVVVKLDAWERRHLSPTGTVTEVLGVTHTPMAEYLAILRRYNLNPEFPTNVTSQANAFNSRVTEADLVGREDFRRIPTITIDPDDAKDFDDAISFQKLQNGNFEIGIHIADVSHYVELNTNLDIEARRRGTSVYLVDRTIPMLPEELSNGICSLNPNLDRLTFSAIFEIDKGGQV
ncbi:MAG: RNB domain-containing ribonuclease, partial [bacterium]